MSYLKPCRRDIYRSRLQVTVIGEFKQTSLASPTCARCCSPKTLPKQACKTRRRLPNYFLHSHFTISPFSRGYRRTCLCGLNMLGKYQIKIFPSQSVITAGSVRYVVSPAIPGNDRRSFLSTASFRPVHCGVSDEQYSAVLQSVDT